MLCSSSFGCYIFLDALFWPERPQGKEGRCCSNWIESKQYMLDVRFSYFHSCDRSTQARPPARPPAHLPTCTRAGSFKVYREEPGAFGFPWSFALYSDNSTQPASQQSLFRAEFVQFDSSTTTTTIDKRLTATTSKTLPTRTATACCRLRVATIGLVGLSAPEDRSLREGYACLWWKFNQISKPADGRGNGDGSDTAAMGWEHRESGVYRGEDASW